MNSKLSFNAIAATLATLGATGLVACGGTAAPARSPVQAHEVPAAAAAPAEASCGAAPTQAKSSPATASNGNAAAGSAADSRTDSAKTADASADPKADANKKAVDTKPMPAMAKKPAAHRTATRARKKRAGGAKSSCGAGTCS